MEEPTAFAGAPIDALPSWNEGSAKQAILDFVKAVTEEGTPAFVPPAERIAVFDNDGTLWCEQPVQFQLAFALFRVQALATEHPEWHTRQPFKAALEGDLQLLAGAGEQGVLDLLMATHAGLSTDAFAQVVADALATARHPRFQRLLTEMVYQPMLQLLAYLRHMGFKNYIFSSGGIEFLRVFSESTFGVPPEHVIGSSAVTIFHDEGGNPTLDRQPIVDFMDDGAGKPVAINKFIGRRPIAAFGNSDRDLQMLEWTAAGPRQPFVLIVHHDDAEREYAYDRDSQFGQLDRVLDQADAKGWTVVSMKDDWNTVFEPAAPVDFLSRDKHWRSKSPPSRTFSSSTATTSIRRLSVRIDR